MNVVEAIVINLKLMEVRQSSLETRN